MCHNAPWLSALDKQMRLQFTPKESKADVMSEFWRYHKCTTIGGAMTHNFCSYNTAVKLTNSSHKRCANLQQK